MSDDQNRSESAPSWTPPPAPPGDGSGAVPTTARAKRSIDISPVAIGGALAVVLLVVALFLKEDGTRLWSDLGVLWSLFALAASVLALLPAVHKLVNVSERVAWQIGAIAAGALVFWWVLFILPVISRNVSFLATLSVAASGVAVWLSPGNTLKDTADTPTPVS